MKVLILAGGLGTRLGEETTLKPKPMVEIGGYPILWHIMKIYSHYGFNDFVVLTGYKSHVIKEYFVNYYQQYSDITVDLTDNSVEIHRTRNEPWKVVKTDKDRAAVVLRTAINMIRLFAILSAPIMPKTSEKMLALLNLPTSDLEWVMAPMAEVLTVLKAGHEFNTPELLFSKIAPERVEELSVRYKEKKEG